MLGFATAALGGSGAVIACARSRATPAGRLLLCGYVAAATGGPVAMTAVFLVFQVCRGAVPALRAGDPGAAAFSLFYVGAIALAAGLAVLVASLAAAPVALAASRMRVRLG